MRTLLTVVGDGTATPVLETALLAARKFDGRVIGLNALTTEYAVVFGGEMDSVHAFSSTGVSARHSRLGS